MNKMVRPSLTRPYDLELEQQLLGMLLLHATDVDRISAFLMPEHFVEDLHSRLFRSIVAVARSGQIPSPFTLRNEFEGDPGLSEVGGFQYFANLCAMAKDCLDAVKWAQAVYGFAFRRRLISVARDIQDAAQDSSIEFGPEKIAEYAETLLHEATAGASPSGSDRFEPLGKIAAQVLKAIDKGPEASTVKFGLTDLDAATGGMRPKELIIIGARPGMGKTAVACHFAQAAARQGVGVGFFSMEMSAASVTLRLLTSLAFRKERDKVDENPAYEAARKGKLTQAHKEELFALEGVLAQMPLKIHEGRGLTSSGIILAARRLQNELATTRTPLGLIIVDHLQKIRPDRDMRGNKVAEMSEISDAMQKMAGTLNVPVIALSQLNRQVEGRNDKRPELADLRESGSIEQDADMVFLLYREAYYLKKKEPAHFHPSRGDWEREWNDWKNKLEIHIAKQRNGSEGKVTAYFDAPSSALGDQ